MMCMPHWVSPAWNCYSSLLQVVALAPRLVAALIHKGGTHLHDKSQLGGRALARPVSLLASQLLLNAASSGSTLLQCMVRRALCGILPMVDCNIQGSSGATVVSSQGQGR
jgi:hypothetical protein